MKRLIVLIVLLSGCATFNADVPIENRLRAAQITLQTIEDVTPELVASGDLSPSDAIKLGEAIDKAQEAIRIAQAGILEGIPTDPVEQMELAIAALRIAQNEVESEKGRQNIGRTIAALVIAKSVMEQNAAMQQ